MPGSTETIEFDDNDVLAQIVGPYGRYLAEIESAFGVAILHRGNLLTIEGDDTALEKAKSTIKKLYARVRKGRSVEPGDVQGAIRLVRDDAGLPALSGTTLPMDAPVEIRTRRRVIEPRSKMQESYIRSLMHETLTFGIGPAGTGKSYLAVAAAVAAFMEKRVSRIVLSRPAVEAGERLGFLPGDMKDKVDPYLRPLYDALYETLGGEQVTKYLESGEIEVAPLAFMRGRTLAHSFVLLDEAQNCTRMQMKMLLTRLGEGSRMAITGDPTQVDLPRGETSGLVEALHILEEVQGISTIRFGQEDVVRHPLVARIVGAYDAFDRERGRQ